MNGSKRGKEIMSWNWIGRSTTATTQLKETKQNKISMKNNKKYMKISNKQKSGYLIYPINNIESTLIRFHLVSNQNKKKADTFREEKLPRPSAREDILQISGKSKSIFLVRRENTKFYRIHLF